MAAVSTFTSYLSSTTSSSSSSYVDVTSTMSGLSASTKYLVIAQANVGGTNQNETFGFQLVERDDTTDTAVANSEMIREPSSTTKTSDYSWAGVVTTQAGGADAGFIMQHKVDDGTGSVVTEAASIVAIDLTDLTEDSDYFVSEDSTEATHTTSLVERNSTELSAANAKDNTWLTIGFMRIDATTVTESAEIVMEEATPAASTTVFTALFEPEDTTEQMPHFFAYAKEYTADEAVTFSLDSRDDAGSSNFNEYKASTIIGLRLNAFEQYAAHYTATADLDNGSSFNDRFSGTITPDTTGTIVLVGSMIANLGSTNRQMFERIQVDSTSIPNTLLESSEACRTYDGSDLIPICAVATHSVTADTAYPYAYEFKEIYSGAGANESGFAVFSTEIASTIPLPYNVEATETTQAGDAETETIQAGDEAAQTT